MGACITGRLLPQANASYVSRPWLKKCHKPQTYDPLFQLYNDNQQKVAFFRPVRPTRYQLGDVYGELHFCSGQNTGTPVSQPVLACCLVFSFASSFATDTVS